MLYHIDFSKSPINLSSSLTQNSCLIIHRKLPLQPATNCKVCCIKCENDMQEHSDKIVQIFCRFMRYWKNKFSSLSKISLMDEYNLQKNRCIFQIYIVLYVMRVTCSGYFKFLAQTLMSKLF